MRFRVILATAAVAAVAAATVATAAPTPDQTVVLSAATPAFAWDGAQGQHADPTYNINDCSKAAGSYCEVFVLDIRSDTPVTLDASLTEFSNALADFDLRVYKSSEDGTGPGEQIESPSFDPQHPNDPSWGGPNGVDEYFSATNVAPGKYWLVAHHYFNPNATYKGNVKVTGATGGVTTAPPPPSGGGTPTPPPSGGGQPTPPPSGSPTPVAGSGAAALPFKVPGTLGSAKKAKKKKSLSFKGTASQDISNLVVTLVNSKKKKVGRAKIASFPKGSRTIKMKVRKLKAGKYQLVAQGIVGGQKQTIVQPVKIKK